MAILKFWYYPLWRYVGQLYRVEKIEAISKLVVQTNKVRFSHKLENSRNRKLSHQVPRPTLLHGGLPVAL